MMMVNQSKFSFRNITFQTPGFHVQIWLFVNNTFVEKAKVDIIPCI